MSFLNPTAFLWALVAVPIVVFYILKIRLRRMPVATIMFWEQIFEQKQPRSIWQHLRHLLSLLVQLALVALLVFALAEPFFRSETRGAKRVVLIVDNSASMNADDVKPSRLAKARDEGRRIIDALRFTDEMAVVAAGTAPEVYCGLTDHPGTLRDALDKIPATDGPTRVKDAIELARRLLADARNRRIVVLSDGRFEDAAELSKADDVEVRTVGEPKTPNVGITRFQVRRSLTDPIGYEILAEVANASDKPADCRIDIELNGNPVDVVPLHLEPGQRWSQAFEKTSAEGGPLIAKLDRADALLADNTAYAILPRREYQPVTLVTTGNLFLQKVFEAIPLVKLATTKTLPAQATPGITVYHRQVPKILPPGPCLVIEPGESTDLWDVGPALTRPFIAKQDDDSPLMAHVKLLNVMMPEARQLTFKKEAKVLAQSETGEPLYAVLDHPGGKVLVLTVNLDNAELPLQTAFPIMMTNAMAAFAGTKGELRESVAAGGLAEVELPESAKGKELALRAPDGSTRPLPRDAGRAVLGPLDRVGIWSVLPKADPKAKAATDAPAPALLEIACNLASRDESDLRAPEGLKAAAVAGRGGWGGRPVWYYLIGAAWLLMGLEWYLYQRRWIS